MNTVAWVTLTETDVFGAMTARERDDFATASSDATVPDRADPVLATLVAEIRGRIATWTQNTLSADAAKIPPSFVAHAVAIARYRLLITIPGYEPGAPREKAHDQGMEFLKDVAAGKMRPETADDAVRPSVPDEKPAGVQFNAPGSRTGRDRMNGL